jgi:hypothetical protein
MTSQPVLDQAKMEAFVHKVLGDTSATLTTILAVLGDRLGLFKDLAAHGPATSDELASRMGMNERYAREWLGGMASAGYLEYEPATRRFTLPPEHAPALAQEGGPVFFGGIYQELPAVTGVLDQLTIAFRVGGGVPQVTVQVVQTGITPPLATSGRVWGAEMERLHHARRLHAPQWRLSS